MIKLWKRDSRPLKSDPHIDTCTSSLLVVLAKYPFRIYMRKR
jgi:hypothetical protein